MFIPYTCVKICNFCNNFWGILIPSLNKNKEYIYFDIKMLKHCWKYMYYPTYLLYLFCNRKLISGQMSMSEEERDRIMKEHEKQMVKVENRSGYITCIPLFISHCK